MDTCENVVWIEPGSGGRVPVVAGLQFGRSEECDVHIRSQKASRHHATIHIQKRVSGIDYLLIDLGSANGSFVNDHRIVRWVQLQNGDHIRIADQEFVFRIQSGSGGDHDLQSNVSTIKESRFGPGWLLVCDIVESTPLVRKMPVQELAKLLASWLHACTKIIETAGGVVTEHRGDGFLAYWIDAPGVADLVAPTIKELRQHGAQLPFRVVLHHGDFTITTDSTKGGERLIGPAVYFAFRVEKIAAAAQRPILLTATARKAIGNCLPLVRVPGTFEVKGFDGSHLFFALEE